MAHPGIGPVGSDWTDDEASKYYTYYQCVVFVLAFMAILCYSPKFIWDAMENNTMLGGRSSGPETTTETTR